MSDLDPFAATEPSDASVAEVIGQLASQLMDYTDEHEIAEVVLGGIAIAGKTASGTPFVITRTTSRDPFACGKLWAAAVEMELDTARTDVQRALGDARSRVAELEATLRMHGIDE